MQISKPNLKSKDKYFGQDIVLILNTANATTKDLATGHASYVLGEPLRFEKSQPKIAVNSFSYTNFFLNISAALVNNKIYYSDDDSDSDKYNITIPDGSYSVETLNTYIVNALNAVGATVAGLFEIVADYSQNKVYIKWGDTLTTWYLSFEAGTPYTLLGFDLDDFVPADQSNSANEINYAPNNAVFNNIEAINIKTNLSNNIVLGTRQSNVLYQSIPSVNPGSVQTDRPQNLLWASSYTLSAGISEIVIDLTDQSGTPMVMSENFVVMVQIHV